MAKTIIEWTATIRPDGRLYQGYTFNPWVGCTKISPACDNCYAEAWATRWGHDQLWLGEIRRTSAAGWKQPLAWNRLAGQAGVRAKVFCASLSDVFDNQAPPAWRAELFARVIDPTHHLDWLLLTKRPQNIAKLMPDRLNGVARRNVWLGTTVENKAEARRIPHLRDNEAAVRFLSCEPLLEAIEPDLDGISWVICGGESGRSARPMKPEWVRRLRDQCAERGVAFFLKQLGTHRGDWPGITARSSFNEWPHDLKVRQFPA